MIRVFVGHDHQQTVAGAVAAFSIARRALVSVTHLVSRQLPLTRPRDERQSTDFAFTRFLVPWLCDYQGTALFVDCDVLCRADISEMFWGARHHAVSVVKHDYTPKPDPKFLDHVQYAYARKNWSSVMVFNNELCKRLTPEYVNAAPGLELHQFKWATGSIGELGREWNHLVGEYEPNPAAKLVHFTLGTPCFARYQHCEFADEWYAERDAMLDYDRRGEYSRPARAAA